jgi:bifunctional protein folC
MTYQETIQYLFNSTPVFEHVGAAAYKPGLYNTHELDQHFGHPHTAYKTIHVAGTNGKGSCSHTLAAILQEAGYKVGLYTSPHLVDFRERIRVNGNPISEQRVIDFVEQERAFFEPLNPSFFELTTALALLYFKEQQVDVAIIEVGLGGRLDCTNIITPVLSLITNISFDHTQFLGNTLEQIAAEKAGIIKQHVPVVIGETTPETRTVFEQKAAICKAPIYFAEEESEVLSSKVCQIGGRDYITQNFGNLHGQLGGEYQERNANTVLKALPLLQKIFNITPNNIVRGFANVTTLTGLRGRWEKLRENPIVICDTGHNVAGWKWLAPQIKSVVCRKLRLVFGMVDDKDVETVIKLLPKNATYYWAQASTKRAIPSNIIAEIGRKNQLVGTDCGTVAEAYHRAITDASADDFIFVGGSSYIVSDLLLLKDF